MPLQRVSSALRLSVLFVVLVGLLTACAHPPDGRGQASSTAQGLEQVLAGQVRLSCDTACIVRWNLNSRQLKALHDNKVWSDLALEVSKIDYPSDLSYYYLGRASEGLGHIDAATIYYRLALTHIHRCEGWLSACDGFDFPKDIRVRLAGLPLAKTQAHAATSSEKTWLTSPTVPSTPPSTPHLAAVPAPRMHTRTGTGFFINAEGLMVTNWHVVENAKSITVTTLGEARRNAQLLAKDPVCDLAVLKLDRGASNWLPIHRSAQKVKRGSEVLTVGFPRVTVQGFESKVTHGLISSLSGVANDPKFFQISVPIQPGNSGGPLVTREGTVVGVISAKLAAQAALDTANVVPENVNYAVKSSCLWDLLRVLPGKHRYDMKRAYKAKVGKKSKPKNQNKEMALVDLTERVEKTIGLVSVTVD